MYHLDDPPPLPEPPPRRLRTAYAYFVRENYHQLMIHSETRRPQEIIAQIGAMWRKLNLEEREPFDQLEKSDRARYEQSKSEWMKQQPGQFAGYMNRRRKHRMAPRRPGSAYVLYKREMCEKIRDEMPNTRAREREQQAIALWRDVDANERELYREKSERDKMRYAKEMQVYLEAERIREDIRIAVERELAREAEENPPDLVLGDD